MNLYDNFLLLGDSITQQGDCQLRGFGFLAQLRDGESICLREIDTLSLPQVPFALMLSDPVPSVSCMAVILQVCTTLLVLRAYGQTHFVLSSSHRTDVCSVYQTMSAAWRSSTAGFQGTTRRWHSRFSQKSYRLLKIRQYAS